MTWRSLLPQLRDIQGVTETGVVALPCPEFSLSSLLHPAAGVLVSLWGSYPALPPVPVLLGVFLCLSLSLFFWFLLFCPVTSLGTW